MRSFLINSFVLCEFISQSYTVLFKEQYGSNRIFGSALKPMVTKEIASDKKTERNFLRNCFVMGEFISQIYTFLFMEQIANIIFMESSKAYS